MEKRTLQNIDKKIEQGAYYDALQLSRAMFDRYAKRKDITGGLNFAEKYAGILADKEQYELTVNLGQRALELLQSVGTVPSEEMLDQLATFFLLCPQGSTPVKYDFMNDLIQWSKSCPEIQLDPQQANEGSTMLHTLMADGYYAEGSFGKAQGHIVFCNDVETMYEMLQAWQKQGYPSEKHFFTLRLVMILLYRNKVNSAEALLERLPIDFDADSIPGPLQYAYLLTAACKYECVELFELLNRKYALLLRTDPGLRRLQAAIAAKYFDIKSEATGLMGMLNSLLKTQPASSC